MQHFYQNKHLTTDTKMLTKARCIARGVPAETFKPTLNLFPWSLQTFYYIFHFGTNIPVVMAEGVYLFSISYAVRLERY